MKWYLVAYHWDCDFPSDLDTEARYGPFASFDDARDSISVIAMAEKVHPRDVAVAGFFEDDDEVPSHDN